MELSLETAKDIWSSESGYKRINNFFCEKEQPNKRTYKPGLFIRGDKTKIDYSDNIYDVESVISVLKNNMKPSNKSQTYYRGENAPKQSFKKEGFISFTQDIDVAIPFMANECCLFEATIDSDVKRLKMGGEKEILIENGCYWEYTGITKKQKVLGKEYNVFMIKIHSPSNDYQFPTLGEVLLGNEPSSKIEMPKQDMNITDEEWDELNSDGGGKKKTVKKRKTIKIKWKKRFSRKNRIKRRQKK